jgi:hypothetical protein
MTWLQFFILTLAVYRTVRLWLYDTITEPLRARVIGNEERSGFLIDHANGFTLWLLELLTCPWCLGVWVSFGAVAALSAAGTVDYGWSPAGVGAATATALAVAAAQSFWHLAEELVVTLTATLDGDDQPS